MQKVLWGLTVGAIAFIGGPVAAQAAGNPEFCAEYANAAINQVNGGLHNPQCIAGMQGARWSTNWRVHYDWCLVTPVHDVETERNVRTGYLRRCTGQ